MAINEIEVSSSSITFKNWLVKIDHLEDVFNKMKTEADQFDLENELPGFHDFDMEAGLIRGYYSGVAPFEVECLVDGIQTKVLQKRIESCEFFLTQNSLFTTGKPGLMKGLSYALSAISGHNVSSREFEFDEMSLLQERMSEVKSIVVSNPKDKEVRRARLAGRIEDYSTYNILDPRNHGIDKVSGVLDTPIGPITLTVNKNGTLRLNVKRDLIILVEHLEWILSLIQSDVGR